MVSWKLHGTKLIVRKIIVNNKEITSSNEEKLLDILIDNK